MNFKRIILILYLFLTFVVSLSHAEKVVVLTIDDGPHSGYTESIIDILKEKEVTATFFLVGKMIKRHPDLVKRIYNNNFEIGNHTYNDIRMTSMTEQQVVQALDPVNRLLEQITGKKTSFFRPPGGRLNRRVLEKARDLGYHTVLWTRNAMDTAPGISAEEIYYHATKNPRKREIILLHSGVGATMQALEDIIEYYKERKYSFKTIADISVPLLAGRQSILKDSGDNWPYILGRKEKFKYPPLGNPLVRPGTLILLGSAVGSIFLIKMSFRRGEKSCVSLAVIGGKEKELERILNILNKAGVQASFFLRPENKNIKSETFKGHSIAVLGEDSDVKERIKQWKNFFGSEDYVMLPFYYCQSGYSKVGVKDIKGEGFIPVDFRITLHEKRPADAQDLYKYLEGNLGAGKTIPLRGDCDFTAKILPALIEKIKERGYNLVSLENQVIKKYAS